MGTARPKLPLGQPKYPAEGAARGSGAPAVTRGRCGAARPHGLTGAPSAAAKPSYVFHAFSLTLPGTFRASQSATKPASPTPSLAKRRAQSLSYAPPGYRGAPRPSRARYPGAYRGLRGGGALPEPPSGLQRWLRAAPGLRGGLGGMARPAALLSRRPNRGKTASPPAARDVTPAPVGRCPAPLPHRGSKP